MRPALGERDNEAGAAGDDAFLSGLDDQSQEVAVAQPCHLGHQVQLTVPAPARIGIDFEQLDLAFCIGAKIKAGIVATAQPLAPVMESSMDLVPPCLSAAELDMVRVAPPPVSEVAGFFSTPVSKSSNIPGGMYGVTVNVGDIVKVTVMVGLAVLVRVYVHVGDIVGE